MFKKLCPSCKAKKNTCSKCGAPLHDMDDRKAKAEEIANDRKARAKEIARLIEDKERLKAQMDLTMSNIRFSVEEAIDMYGKGRLQGNVYIGQRENVRVGWKDLAEHCLSTKVIESSKPAFTNYYDTIYYASIKED